MRKVGESFHCLALTGMPVAVRANHQQPLIAIKITVKRMRKKVPAKITVHGARKIAAALTNVPKLQG